MEDLIDQIWQLDADNVQLDGIKKDNLKDYVILNASVSQFLEQGFKTKQIIVGPRGSGKSLILNIKAELFRQANTYKVLPSKSRRLEHLGDLNIDDTNKLHYRYETAKQWADIWRVGITIWILQYNQIKLTNGLEKIFGKNNPSLSAIVRMILNNRRNISEILDDINREYPNVFENFGQTVIFLDNLDQAFGADYVVSNKGNNDIMYTDLWKNAQIGLITTTHSINSSYSHIQVFISIRSEAYRSYLGTNKIKYDAISVELKYTKEELKRIIGTRIDKSIQLISVNEDYEKYKVNINFLIQNISIPHNSVKNKALQPVSEYLFDYAIRHTFERPKEIIDIYRTFILITEKLDINKIKQIVNSKSLDFLKYLISGKEIGFKIDAFNHFCKEVNKNEFSYKEAETISNNILSNLNEKNFLSYLFRFGLIGKVQSDENSNYTTYTQIFNDAGLDAFLEQEVGQYPFYILHPSVTEYTKHVIIDSPKHLFISQFNVIGNGLPFVLKRSETTKQNHIHFGFDQLSRISVIPELSKIRNLLIIMTLEDFWSDFGSLSKSKIVLSKKIQQGNFTDEIEINIISDENYKYIDLVSNWQNGIKQVLIMENSEEIGKLASHSSSISLVGLQRNEKYVSKISDFAPEYNGNLIFYFKYYYSSVINNYHKFINSFKNQSNINLDIGIIDAFEVERYDYENDYSYTTKFEVDEFKIYNYALTRKTGVEVVSVKSDSIKIVENEKEFKYFESKLRLIVEGAYQFNKLIWNSKDNDKLFEIFLRFQKIKLKKICSKNCLGYENVDSYSKLEEKINRFCLKTKTRVSKLVKKDFNIDNIVKYKKSGIFPDIKIFNSNIKDIYDEFSKIHFYEFISVISINTIKKSNNKIFISYSTSDFKECSEFYYGLKIFGYDTWLWDIDSNHERLRDGIDSNISNRDVFMFISSKNSIYSDKCHKEIFKFREKRILKKLICLKLDDSIHSYDENRIDNLDVENVGKYRSLCASNIKHLLEHNVSNMPREYIEMMKLIEIIEKNDAKVN